MSLKIGDNVKILKTERTTYSFDTEKEALDTVRKEDNE